MASNCPSIQTELPGPGGTNPGAFHRARDTKRRDQKRSDGMRRHVLAHRPVLDPIFESRCDALPPVTWYWSSVVKPLTVTSKNSATSRRRVSLTAALHANTTISASRAKRRSTCPHPTCFPRYSIPCNNIPLSVLISSSSLKKTFPSLSISPENAILLPFPCVRMLILLMLPTG
jgi:hypothetical protein